MNCDKLVAISGIELINPLAIPPKNPPINWPIAVPIASNNLPPS